MNILDSDDLIIETLDADYEDIDSLNNLNVINTMRYIKHVKNCALQNVLKIYNWCSQCQKKSIKFKIKCEIFFKYVLNFFL